MSQVPNQALPKYRFDWKGAAALFFGGFVPAMALSIINVLMMMLFKVNYQFETWYMVLLNLVMWSGAILSFDYFICRPQTGKHLRFNFSTKNLSTYLLVFPLMLGVIFIAEFFTSLIPISGPVFGPLYEYFSEMMEQLTSSLWGMILMAVLMAPVFEEIVFRGIIQKGLINRGYSAKAAIWIAAFLFGLVHANPWQFVGAVLLGAAIGYVYERTKSLFLAILLHMFNNALAAVLIYVGGTESFADYFGISVYLLLALGLVLLGVFYYLFTYKYEIHHSE